VRVVPEHFIEHLALRLPKDDAANALRDVRAADLYLAYACSIGNKSALAAFEKTFMPAVSDFVARRHAGRAFADEVRQVLRQRLFVGHAGSPPKIATYTGAGPLGAWLRVTAVRTAQNLLARRDDLRAIDLPTFRSPDPDPEVLHLKRTYGRE